MYELFSFSVTLVFVRCASEIENWEGVILLIYERRRGPYFDRRRSPAS
jgi:hypothetical protein